ncbi:hypothetical protein KI387_025152, partial [Taxus chinensis]
EHDANQHWKCDIANQKAKLAIVFGILDEVQPHIRDSTPVKDIWDKLSTVNQVKNQNLILHMQSQFHYLKIENSKKIEVFLS